MKANRKADLQRKLTLRVVPTPPPPPAPPEIAKQQETERGRLQVAEADNGPADREMGQRQKLLRDERKDSGKDDRKSKEESTKAANELKGVDYLDKTQAQP